MDKERAFLRHTLATVAYRTTRALEGAPESFGGFDGAGRTPGQILAHMGDLFDWALSVAAGRERWKSSSPLAWEEEQKRYFAALGALDDFLASADTIAAPVEQLFQAPVADALTHVGQLAMLRRLAGSPTCGENFYVAAIEIGQVTNQQPQAMQLFK